MVQPLNALGPALNIGRDVFGTAAHVAQGASNYAGDWRQPIGLPATLAGGLAGAVASKVAGALAHGGQGNPPQIDGTTRAKQNALLSADVYNDTPNPPAGFRVAGQGDLDKLGITPSMLEQPGSSFRARVYATGEGSETRYVVAFRGSQTGEDWKNNFQQGLGLHSESYAKALEIGRHLARSDAPVTLTGHSLGGGLASAAALASGREADTFNAAGLSDGSIVQAKGIAQANGRGEAAIQAYHVKGEVLTDVQNGGDRVAGGILGGVLGGIVLGPLGSLGGSILGASKADAPEAYGTQHTLPNVVPEGKSWLDTINPVDRHMIDWVLAGAGAL